MRWQFSLAATAGLLLMPPSRSSALLGRERVEEPAQMSGGAEREPDKINIVYASDAAGFPGLLRSMISLGRNVKDSANCIVHLIVPAQDVPAAEHMVTCFRRELAPFGVGSTWDPEVILHVLRPSPISATWRFTNPAHQPGIARLFLDEYLPDAPRALWLDSDTIITSDVGELYREPMDHALAAVREGPPRTFHVVYSPWFKTLRRELSNPDMLVFNAGVMLIDFRRWKSDGIRGEIMRYADNIQRAGPQLLLNLVFQVERNFTELPAKYNVFGLGGVFPPRLEQAQQASILHWSGPNKPWSRETQVQEFQAGPGFLPFLYKAGVHLPNLGHEQFDYLVMPYVPRRECSAPTFFPM